MQSVYSTVRGALRHRSLHHNGSHRANKRDEPTSTDILGGTPLVCVVTRGTTQDISIDSAVKSITPGPIRIVIPPELWNDSHSDSVVIRRLLNQSVHLTSRTWEVLPAGEFSGVIIPTRTSPHVVSNASPRASTSHSLNSGKCMSDL